MIRRPTILELAPRIYRIVDTVYVPVGQDVRPAGLALIILSIVAFLLFDVDLGRDALIPFALATLGVLGVLIVVKAPLWRQRVTLLDLDLSRGVFATPFEGHNGSGGATLERPVAEVDELLFALRQVPLEPGRRRTPQIDAWATYVRLLDGEIVPVVESSLDHDRTFRVATFLADAFDVGIKQVGKGWKD